MKKIAFVLCTLLFLVACSSDDDITMNDVVGKWECSSSVITYTDVKTGEIIHEATLEDRWNFALYENGTGRDIGDDKIWPYEVKGNQLIINGSIKWNLQLVSHDIMKLSKEEEYFDYDKERQVRLLRLLTYMRRE